MSSLNPRIAWTFRLIGIIATGILSRLIHTGTLIVDKYLGDALYAAMIYAIFRQFIAKAPAVTASLVLMTAIECFQVTMVPARLLASDRLIVRLCAHLLGTEFSLRDLLAYAVGIGCIWLADSLP